MNEIAKQGPQGLAGEATEVWEHAGLRCAIVPMRHLGMFNGYVRLPDGHPGRAGTHGQLDSQVEVHGGLTYGPDPDGWVGFDTGHTFDAWAPDDLIGYLDETAMRYFGMGGMGGRNQRLGDLMREQWTIPRLRAEVEHLAEQLADPRQPTTRPATSPDRPRS